jgi:hypothetical protein
MDIDAIIAEAQAPVEAQPQAEQTEISNEIEDQKPQEEAAEQSDANSDDDTVVFPKKAINALSRKDKQIGKLRQELNQLRAMQQQAKPEPVVKPTDQTSDAPNIADFENHIDYLEARADWKAEQKMKEFEGKQTQTQQTQQEQQWLSHRVNEVDRQSEEFAKEYPQVIALAEQHAETIQALPQSIRLALLKSDNPPLAFYNLAKSGVIEELGDMSIEDARVEIKLALRQQPSKPKSSAPKPMSQTRGIASGGKDLTSMTPDELLKWVRN